MATRYSADLFVPNLPVAALVLRAHRVLELHGLILDANPEVWVDDQDVDDPIPEYVASSVEDAARYAEQWPHASAMGYSLRHAPTDPSSPFTGYVVRVFYSSHLELSVLGLGFIGNAFQADHFPDTLPLITSLVEALHEEFSACRSGFDWGFSDDVREADEILALTTGRVEARPPQWLDIIDPALVTEEVLAEYEAAKGPTSLLRRTANASLFWQRDAGPP